MSLYQVQLHTAENVYEPRWKLLLWKGLPVTSIKKRRIGSDWVTITYKEIVPLTDNRSTRLATFCRTFGEYEYIKINVEKRCQYLT